jgi:hypothetical protein
MKKFWTIFGWAVTLAAQITISFVLVELFNATLVPETITTVAEFLTIPLTIWASFLIGIFAIGMLSLVMRKIKPYYTTLRFLGTLVMAVLPMVLLVFLGLSAGLENTVEFQEIVLDRMVPYYTQLNIVFSLLGFYLPSWFKRNAPERK